MLAVQCTYHTGSAASKHLRITAYLLFVLYPGRLPVRNSPIDQISDQCCPHRGIHAVILAIRHSDTLALEPQLGSARNNCKVRLPFSRTPASLVRLTLALQCLCCSCSKCLAPCLCCSQTECSLIVVAYIQSAICDGLVVWRMYVVFGRCTWLLNVSAPAVIIITGKLAACGCWTLDTHREA